MKRSMVIQNDSGSRLHMCRSCKMDYKNGSDAFKEEMIKTFYSARHAIDSGWIYTKHPMHCPSDESAVWICPACSKKKNKLIEVCGSCNRACCWYGEFMCDESRGTGTVKKSARELAVMKLEHPDYWSDKKMIEVYGEPAPHGYTAQ